MKVGPSGDPSGCSDQRRRAWVEVEVLLMVRQEISQNADL